MVKARTILPYVSLRGMYEYEHPNNMLQTCLPYGLARHLIGFRSGLEDMKTMLFLSPLTHV